MNGVKGISAVSGNIEKEEDVWAKTLLSVWTQEFPGPSPSRFRNLEKGISTQSSMVVWVPEEGDGYRGRKYK